MNILTKLRNLFGTITAIAEDVLKIRLALGRIEGRQLVSYQQSTFNAHEFSVSSQWGEDGLIEFIISNIEIINKIFIEFGVENYVESNTRFLLQNRNWAGLIIDGDDSNIQYIKRDSLYWRYNLKAICSFINRDNINSIIKSSGLAGDIGLLSIDIDGNDYFVFEAISIINPRIVVCEYNSLWGDSLAVSVPYDPNFVRTKAHFSNLYFGASISALTRLAKKKGYSLVGSNTTGVNCFFVRNDLLGDLQVVTPKSAWVKSQFRESRNLSGSLTFLSFEERLALLSDLPLLNFDDNKIYNISDLFSVNNLNL